MSDSQINPRRARQLFEAKFDPRMKTYVYVGGILFCVITIIGILLLPFWLIFGKLYIDKYFDHLFCELTTRALHFRKGVWFKTERTIPLDKIQDLTFREGPVLRYFGLSSLYIETAGQSAQSTADMTLTGIMDAHKFREMVMDQRDDVTNFGGSSSSQTTTENQTSELIPMLSSIHETLKKIEKKL